MPILRLLTDKQETYRTIIESAKLPGLSRIITTQENDCDIVLGDTSRILEALPNLPTLKWIQTSSAGVERLLDPALRHDYILTNARGVFGESMSEYVFGYLLMYKKRIFERYKAQQLKHWDNNDGGLLRGRTIGLLGVGSIGAHLAGSAKHFGMKVRGYTLGSETSAHVDRYYHDKDLLEFANGLDYLISVLPKTKNTDKIVNSEVLNALPSHAIFINVGRGNALDESALVDALGQNKIAGAVLDVTDMEPLPEEHPFWTTPNLLLTFHTSAISYPEDIAGLFIENYHLYIEGEPLKYQVDFEKGY